MQLLLLLIAYTKPINDDLLLEKLLHEKSFQLYNFRFSYPNRFISPILYDYNPAKSVTFQLNFEIEFNNELGIDFYPTFLYDRLTYGIVVEPLFRTGKTSGWPYLKWHNKIAGAFSRAYLFYDKSPLTILLGRTRLQLNLESLLSEEDPPIDLIFASYKNSSFNFSFFTGQLDSYITQDSSCFYKPGETFNRYISGHSIEFRRKNYSLSFSELALYFTSTNLPDPYFLNPFILYHTRFLDTEENGDHNVFWILAGNYQGAKFISQFEFSIDDWHIPDVNVWGPNKFAWIFRTYFTDFPRTGFQSGISYSGATRWVFVHRLELLYFKNKTETMGTLNDNDFDSLSIFLRKPILNSFNHCKLTVSYKRKGEGSINDKDYTYYLDSGPLKTFLSGTVEHHLGSSINFEIITKNSRLMLDISLQKIFNSNHIKGKSSLELSAKIFISTRAY
jgi:hypothetical protein